MQIESFVFGKLTIDPSKVITFEKGLPGFEDSKRYTLLLKEKEGEENNAQAPQLLWMQSVDRPEVSFTIADPLAFGINYSFTLSDEEVALLGDGSPEDVLVFVLLFKDDATGDVNTNTKSPLVINMKSLKGLQKVLVSAEPTVTIIEKKPG